MEENDNELGDSQVLKKLKRILLKLELPLLARKWDIIDLNFIGKYEKALLNRAGLSKAVISKIKNNEYKKH